MPKKPLDRRGSISRDNDLALLAAGIETGWWDERGIPAPWPEDFCDPNNRWHHTKPTDQPVLSAPGEPPF